MENSQWRSAPLEDAGSRPQWCRFAKPLAIFLWAFGPILHAQSFDDVLARVTTHRIEAAAIAEGPSIRIETTTGVARTQDLFFKSPYESRSASAVLAVDYPLFDATTRGIARAIADNELEQARRTAMLADADFETLLAAYAGLWLANDELARTASLAKDVQAVSDRGEELVRQGAISNITATQWEEIALALRTRQLDAEVRKLDEASRLRQYVDEEVTPSIEAFDKAPSVDPEHHPEVLLASARVARARLAVEEAENTRRPQFAFSGFAGLGAADATFQREQSNGTFGIYGLRFRMTYSLRESSYAAARDRAKRELESAEAQREIVMRRAKAQLASELLRIDTQRKRIELLSESVDVSKRRQQSLVRLVAAGVQPGIEELRASAESLVRELRLNEARVEAWKSFQRLRRLGAL